MDTGRSYWDMYDEYRNRNNLDELIDSTLNKTSSEFNFSSVKSCLAIGPGEGSVELKFIKKCTPNISKLTAVEPDHESVEHLKVLLRESLPGVESMVIESYVGKWKDPNNAVDLVAMFHSLYEVLHGGRDGRRTLLKRAHDSWLADGGYLAVIMSSPRRVKSPRCAYEVFERLGTPLEPVEEVEEDILDVGFIKQHVYEMHHVQDFSNPNDDYLAFFQRHMLQPVTLDDVRRVLKQLYPDDKGENYTTLAIYKKAL